jgi:hypothetical protein
MGAFFLFRHEFSVFSHTFEINLNFLSLLFGSVFLSFLKEKGPHTLPDEE